MIDAEQKNIRHTHVYTHAYTQIHMDIYTDTHGHIHRGGRREQIHRGGRREGKRDETEKILESFVFQGYTWSIKARHTV